MLFRSESKARNFNNIALYDILPFEGDYQIWTNNNAEPISRGSQWSGWLKDLDSIKVKRFSAADSTMPADGITLTDGVDMDIWVGPYEEDPATGRISLADPSDLFWMYMYGDKVVYGPNYGSFEDGKDPDDLEQWTDSSYYEFEKVRLGEYDEVTGNLITDADTMKRRYKLVKLADL